MILKIGTIVSAKDDTDQPLTTEEGTQIARQAFLALQELGVLAGRIKFLKLSPEFFEARGIRVHIYFELEAPCGKRGQLPTYGPYSIEDLRNGIVRHILTVADICVNEVASSLTRFIKDVGPGKLEKGRIAMLGGELVSLARQD